MESIQMEFSSPARGQWIRVQATNNMPLRVNHVRCRTKTGEVKPLADGMEPGEIAAIYFRLPQPTIEVSWTLPTAMRCFKTMGLRDSAPAPKPPIAVTLEKVPNMWKALEPLPVTVRLTNTTDAPVTGSAVVNQDDKGLMLIEKSDMKFAGLQAGASIDFVATFIGVYEGVFQFPKISVGIEGGQNFVTNVDDGVMMVGSV
jgi:hypothetical protein